LNATFMTSSTTWIVYKLK